MNPIMHLCELTLRSTAPAVILAAFLLTTTIANAAIYFVATNGSDSNPGTLAQPFRTIGKGASSLKSGDTLYIRGGVYDATIGGWDIPAGLPGQNTTIAGYGSENPIVRPSSIPNSLVINLSRGYQTIQDLTLDAINGGGNTGCAYLGHNILFLRMICLNAGHDGIRVVGENTTIRDSHIKDCGRILTFLEDTKGLGIHANGDDSNTSNLLIEGNLIEGCRAGGIAVHQEGNTRNVTVRNNIIHNFGSKSTWPQRPDASPQYGTGITFGHGTDYYAYNNLIYNGGNATGGSLNQCFLGWGGGLSRPGGGFYYFYNNTCHDMDVGVQLWDVVTNVTARNNILSNVGRVDLLGNGANNTNTNYVTNPTFVNSGAGDFRLQSGSPGIGQGANLSSVFTTDINGVSRGSSFDIGAYQYMGSSGMSRPTSPINLQVSR